MSNFISVSIDDVKMSRFKNRFAQRKQVAVMNQVKTAEAAGAVLLLQEIIRQIDQQGLVDTGVYRSSWTVETGRGYAKALTRHGAAARLEYGFSGADSLGRVYNNPARPHVRPALMATRKEIARGFSTLIVKELNDD